MFITNRCNIWCILIITKQRVILARESRKSCLHTGRGKGSAAGTYVDVDEGTDDAYKEDSPDYGSNDDNCLIRNFLCLSCVKKKGFV